MRANPVSLLQSIMSFTLIFTVFLSFSSENASGGFYAKFYLLLMVLSVGSLTCSFSKVIRYLRRHKQGVYLFIIAVIALMIWNGLASEFDLSYSIVIMIVSLVGCSVFVLGRVRPNMVIRILKLLIYLNVGALAYQFFLYIVLGDLTYLHADLFSFSRDKYQLAVGGTFARFSSFHLEPGSYSTMMALLLIFYRSLTGQMDTPFYVGLLSIPMTFSTVGLMYVALIGLIVILQTNWSSPRNMLLAVFGFFALIAGLILGGVVEGLIQRFGDGASEDSSLNYKVLNVTSYLNFTLTEFITGLGIDRLDRDCVGCNYIKSNGVLFFMLYSLGVFGFAMIAALLSRAARSSVVCLLFSLILILCRYPVMFPVFWLTYLSLWNWRSVPDGLMQRRRRKIRFRAPKHPAHIDPQRPQIS